MLLSTSASALCGAPATALPAACLLAARGLPSLSLLIPRVTLATDASHVAPARGSALPPPVVASTAAAGHPTAPSGVLHLTQQHWQPLLQQLRAAAAAALDAQQQQQRRGCHAYHASLAPRAHTSATAAASASAADPMALARPYEVASQMPEVYHPRPDPHRILQPPPEVPALAALCALGARQGVANTVAFAASVQRLSAQRQFALVRHADSVATCLRGMGVGAAAVAALLQHCPALFSHPAEDRTAPLMAELMGERLRLTAAQAADVFVRCPALGNTRNLMVPIVRLVVEQQGGRWQAQAA